MIFLFIIIIGVLSIVLKETCKYAPLKSTAFCDVSLPIEKRVSVLIPLLSLKEKIGFLFQTSFPIERLSLNHFEWWEEGLHGIGVSPGANFTGEAAYVSSFPQVTNLGRTFDFDLFKAISTAISDEVRALNNIEHGFLSIWSPNLNIQRDPRWGRGQETPGEDPYLTSQYGYQYITGMQGNDPKYLKVAATCKHYTAYDLDSYHGMDRHHFNAKVNPRDLEETFQPPFKMCVKDAGVHQIMCSYNEVNGVPSCANSYLLDQTLRKEWGFDGIVTSDCGAIWDVYQNHKYTPTAASAVGKSMTSGTDLDCGFMYSMFTNEALSLGLLNESTLDTSIYRLIKLRMELGEFDPWNKQAYRNISSEIINCEKHKKLALEAAQKSIVLLKNKGSVLPLKKADLPLKVAVLGPNADAKETMLGNYYGKPEHISTVLEGIQSYLPDPNVVKYSKGCDIQGSSKDRFEDALRSAQESDVVVMVMGIDQTVEREGHDRDDIGMTGVQADLVKYIRQGISKQKPIILVMINGGPIDFSEILDDVDAVLYAGYPGQAGGQAVADAIFGLINPGGRLSHTIYYSDYVKKVDFENMDMRAGVGRTYKFFNGSVVYPFGFGLSYSKFGYEWVKVEKNVVSVEVTNEGKVKGDEIVLGFIENTWIPDAPKKKLFSFQRMNEMEPGEKRVVKVPISQFALEYVDVEGNRKVVHGKYKLYIGDLEKTMEL